MSNVNILVPDLPESISDATVSTWHKKPGDMVSRDEVLVEIETDKVVLEIPSTIDGIIEVVLKDEGATVTSRQILCQLKESNSCCDKESIAKSESKMFKPAQRQTIKSPEELSNESLTPIIRDILTEDDLSAIITKDDKVDDCTKVNLESHLKKQTTNQKQDFVSLQKPLENRSEKRIPMTRLRKCISERLLKSKKNTVMLTTINEVNMKPIIDLRKQYGDAFEKRHGVRLGFMSFYTKAVAEALKRYPEVNASIDGDDVIYYNYFDISIAISTPRGLVTPVLKDVDMLSIAEIEKKIKKLVLKGHDGNLTIEELTGGNFTITNGGIFGSLISTPIINPPQSAILGIHVIKDRPMAVNQQVVILPMMYLALSYDHRLIDGRESVSYLIAIKEMLEDPSRLLLDV